VPIDEHTFKYVFGQTSIRARVLDPFRKAQRNVIFWWDKWISMVHGWLIAGPQLRGARRRSPPSSKLALL